MNQPAQSAAVTFLAALCLLMPPGARLAVADEAVPVATVLDVQGPVFWRTRAETTFHDVRGGERLFAGAVVRTGVRATAHLAWRNGGDFKLMALSELEVPDAEGVKLNSGSVWAQFQHKLLVPFFFQSPSATAVVRGTVLGVELQPEGGTHVSVLEGRVEVSGVRGGQHMMLAPGQAVTVSPFGQLGPLEPVSPRDHVFGHRGPQGPDQGRGGGHHPDGENPPTAAGGPPQAADGPRGPGRGGPGPGGRGPTMMVRSGVDWLQHNRAADHLEEVRQDFRGNRGGRPDGGNWNRPMAPGPPPMRPHDPDQPEQDTPGGVSLDQTFPFGRRPDGDRHMQGPGPGNLPLCPPGVPPSNTSTGAMCTPPPAQSRTGPGAPPPVALPGTQLPTGPGPAGQTTQGTVH